MDLDASVMDKFPLDPGKGLTKESKVLISPFVILHHTGHVSHERGDHWDWLIKIPEYFLSELAPRMQANPSDQNQGLLTFASEIHPSQWSSGTRFWRLAPHRNLYMEYEGQISQGRGNVKRIASGQLHWIFLSDFLLQFHLFGLGWLDDCQNQTTFGGGFHQFELRTILFGLRSAGPFELGFSANSPSVVSKPGRLWGFLAFLLIHWLDLYS